MVKQKFINHTRYVLINRLAAPVCAFALLVVIGRHSDSLLGSYALVMTFYFIMQMLPLLGLTTFVMREVARAPELAGAYFNNVGFMSLIGCVAVDVLAYAYFQFFEYPEEVKQATAIAGLLIFPGIMLFLAEIILMSLHHTKPIAMIALVENGFKVLISIIALTLGGGLVALISVLLFTRVLSLVAYLYVMKRDEVVEEYGVLSRSILKKTLGVLPAFLAGACLFIIVNRVDFVVLSIMESVEVIGYYAIGYRVLEISVIIISALLMALFPLISKKFVGAKGHYRVTINAIIVGFTLVLSIACFIGVLFVEYYVLILFNKQYPYPVLISQLFVGGLLVFGLDFVVGGVLMASDRQKLDLKANVLGAVVTLALLLFLVPVYGIYGAFLAKLLAGLVQTTAKFVFVSSSVGRVLDGWALFKLSVLVLLIVLLPFSMTGYGLAMKVVLFVMVALLVPVVAILLGLVHPMRLLRFYWKPKNAADVTDIAALVDNIVADSRATTRYLRSPESTQGELVRRQVYGLRVDRLSRFLFLKGHTKWARGVGFINALFTGVVYSPESIKSSGLVPVKNGVNYSLVRY